MKKIHAIVLLAVLLGLPPETRGGAVSSPLADRLAAAAPRDRLAILITLVEQADTGTVTGQRRDRRQGINRLLRATAASSQGPLLAFLRQAGAVGVRPFWIVNSVAATVPAKAVERIAARPEVANVRLDGSLSLPRSRPVQATTPEWNLDAVKAPVLWAMGHTGEGVVVAAMDTGVDADHPDLGPRWRGGINSWYDPHGEHASPHDSDGHGTQVMSVMVGGEAGGSAIGMAPGATWIAVKVFDDTGNASYSDIHSGFQWILDPDDDPATDDAPDVVNGSWGYDTFLDQCFTEFQPDVQALKAAGIGVVFSAGNNGPGSSTSVSPANYPESVGVGSVDDTLAIVDSSGRGPSACGGGIFPELVAPGMSVRAADLTFGGLFPDSYVTVSGTSIAAPHVAGAMALLLSAAPQLTVSQLEAALTGNTVDLGDSGPDNTYGNGLLDVDAAYTSFTRHLLQVTMAGNGSGGVTASPSGISCPGDCEGEYIEGTTVTLTAVPDPHSRFAGWSGACSGTTPTCELPFTGPATVTAYFSPFPWHLFLTPITGGTSGDH
ncbi:MAG: hypothetical protein Kow0089_06300 [Desulfobulbaceae bacterium]